jgi:hypothetical protein
LAWGSTVAVLPSALSVTVTATGPLGPVREIPFCADVPSTAWSKTTIMLLSAATPVAPLAGVMLTSLGA